MPDQTLETQPTGATCSACGQNMRQADGCTLGEYDDFADGVERKRIAYGDETRWEDGPWSDPCHDCLARVGRFHHPGCDMEECPKCHGQAISCGCA